METKYKVVIIEDDLIISEVLKNKINNLSNFIVENTYQNPVLFLADELHFDIILLDVVMPEMNGIDAIDPILLKYPEALIVMNTIKDDQETIFTALKRGALGFIDKQSFDVNYEDVLLNIAKGGAYMTPSIARKVVSNFQDSNNTLEKLSPREKDIANRILEGLSYKLVAIECGISIDTVRIHIKNIYRKLKINSKSQLFNLINKRF
jgi:DNA-binding NarL/FixJ family response regulator